MAQRAVDWSNSLLLSCRFTAWREGDFNEYVYNFLKSLSRERMRRAEAEVVAVGVQGRVGARAAVLHGGGATAGCREGDDDET